MFSPKKKKGRGGGWSEEREKGKTLGVCDHYFAMDAVFPNGITHLF